MKISLILITLTLISISIESKKEKTIRKLDDYETTVSDNEEVDTSEYLDSQINITDFFSTKIYSRFYIFYR